MIAFIWGVLVGVSLACALVLLALVAGCRRLPDEPLTGDCDVPDRRQVEAACRRLIGGA